MAISNLPNNDTDKITDVIKEDEEVTLLVVNGEEIAIKRNIEHENNYRDYENNRDYFTEKYYDND
jgi:hypothetical protein